MAHADGRHHAGNGHAVCRQTADVVADLLQGITDNGGATVSVVHSRNVPATGYVVAVKGHELRTGGPGTLDALVEYVQRKRGVVAGSLVSRPRFVGAWVDGSDVVLDVVEILSDRAEAVAAGKARGELAVWDLAAGEEIRTD